jgi:hypothetical protein
MIILEHNVKTGKAAEREATAEEIAQAELDAANEALLKAELQAKADAKAALLNRLGITADEAELLLS